MNSFVWFLLWLLLSSVTMKIQLYLLPPLLDKNVSPVKKGCASMGIQMYESTNVWICRCRKYATLHVQLFYVTSCWNGPRLLLFVLSRIVVDLLPVPQQTFLAISLACVSVNQFTKHLYGTNGISNWWIFSVRSLRLRYWSMRTTRRAENYRN